MTMTPAEFRSRLETLDSSDLEGYSDVAEEFGADLMAYRDRAKIANETVSIGINFDDQCCRALSAITHGETLEQVLSHVTDAHSAAPGARAILANLRARWHAPA